MNFSSEFKSYYWRKKRNLFSLFPWLFWAGVFPKLKNVFAFYDASLQNISLATQPNFLLIQPMGTNIRPVATTGVCSCVRVCTLFPSSPLLQTIHQPNTHFLKQNPCPPPHPTPYTKLEYKQRLAPRSLSAGRTQGQELVIKVNLPRWVFVLRS